jgi:hypothetical protein
MSPAIDDSSGENNDTPNEVVPDMVRNVDTAAEDRSLQAEKLDAIRRAIDSGEYDSEHILQIAMQRMLDSVEGEENVSQAGQHDDSRRVTGRNRGSL